MGRSLAILGVPGVLGEHKRTLIITDFTQSLGPELLANSDFSAWTGDNPDGWTVTGESGGDPEVTERDPNQGHADAKTVGGAANLYASVDANWLPRLSQTILTIGKWYEAGCLITNRVAGSLWIHDGANKPFTALSSAVTAQRGIARAASNAIIFSASLAPPRNITIDDVTTKLIALNIQQVMPANAIMDFTYTLPASPAASECIMLFYRISDVSLEAGYNCWQAYVQRNAANSNWDFRLDSVNAGTVTNRINATNIGNTVGLRVQCDGTLHDCWTTADGTTWTKRGAQVNVSWNDGATGVNTVYSSQATPTKLTVTPL